MQNLMNMMASGDLCGLVLYTGVETFETWCLGWVNGFAFIPKSIGVNVAAKDVLGVGIFLLKTLMVWLETVNR